MIYFVAHIACLRFLLEEIAQAAIEVAVDSVGTPNRNLLLCSQNTLEITALESMILSSQLVQGTGNLHCALLRTVIFQIELEFLYRLGQHELVLAWQTGLSLHKGFKGLVYLNDLFEVKLLEVDVHSPDQKINQVALLQFVITEAPQSF